MTYMVNLNLDVRPATNDDDADDLVNKDRTNFTTFFFSWWDEELGCTCRTNPRMSVEGLLRHWQKLSKALEAKRVSDIELHWRTIHGTELPCFYPFDARYLAI